MSPRIHCILSLLLAATAASVTAAEKVTYDEQVRPLLKARCFRCHGEDEQNADLNLQTFVTALAGGSSGPVLKPGRPNSSLLFQAITHSEGVEAMPPNADKLPEEEIETIRRWITGGLLENSGSKVRETAGLELGPLASGRPDVPVMPANLPHAAEPPTHRPHPVTALAASPWAPLLAVGRHGCVTLVHTETAASLGTLPFAEGVPFVLRFSSGGDLLLAAGGKPVQNGAVVLYDVRSGKQLGRFGDENDAVLAADITADGGLVALGGPGKTVKVLPTRGGPAVYQIKNHTDWITALEFSPDGRLLATADRAGGILIWDAPTGSIVLTLNEHKASITSLSWRADSRLLASASEDGNAIVWDMKDGFPSATLTDIHAPNRQAGTYGKLPNGVLAVDWTTDGRLLTVGRDRCARSWDAAGTKLSQCPPLVSLPTRMVACSEPGLVCIGDTAGAIHMFTISGPAWSEVPR